MTPDIRVYVDFTALPTEVADDWEDITTYVRNFSIKRGRNFELDRMEAGTCTLVLDNSTGIFDITNTSSPYYPHILPLRRIKVCTVADDNFAEGHTLFTGYVEGWPQTYLTDFETTMTVEATDAFSVLARIGRTTSYDATIVADDPIAYYKLDEDSGSVAADDSGFLRDGTYAPNTPESRQAVDGTMLGTNVPLVSDGGKSIRFVDGIAYEPTYVLAHPDARVDHNISASGSFTGSEFSVEAWIRPLHASNGVIWLQDSAVTYAASGDIDEWIEEYVNGYGILRMDDASNQLVFATSPTDDQLETYAVATDDGLTLGDTYHVVAVQAAVSGAPEPTIYINGVEVATSTIVLSTVASDATNDITIGAPPKNVTSFNDSGFDGFIDNVAIYDTALSAETIAEHYDVGSAAGGSALSGSRITFALTQGAGLDTSLQDIDTGLSLISETDADGSLLEYIQKVTDSEGGVFYVDVNGRCVFKDRHYGFTDADSVTSLGTFGDDGTELPYVALELEYDEDLIFNHVTMTDANGNVASVVDTDSIDAYMERRYSKDSLLTDVEDARSAAQWLLANYAEPTVRIRSMVIEPVAHVHLWNYVLMLDLTNRVTVLRRTPGGTTLTWDVLIEGVEHDYDASTMSWVANYSLRPVSPDPYLVADHVASTYPIRVFTDDGDGYSEPTTTTGQRIKAIEDAAYALEGTVFGSAIASGTAYVGTRPQGTNTQVAVVLDTDDQTWTTITTTGAPGGASLDGVAIVNVSATGIDHRAAFVSAVDDSDYDFTTYDRFPAWVVLDSAATGIDTGLSVTVEELVATNGTHGASAFPAASGAYGAYNVNTGLYGIDVAPDSGHALVALRRSAQVIAIDPTTSNMVGFIDLGDITDADGRQITVLPKAIATDPTSVEGDERFAVLYDAYDRYVSRLFVAGHSYSVGVGATSASGLDESLLDELRDDGAMWHSVIDTFGTAVTGFDITDTFTRTSAVDLGTVDGYAWTSVYGTWGTNGSSAYLVASGGTSARNSAILSTSVIDGTASAKLSYSGTLSLSNQMGICGRLYNQNTMILAKLVPSFGTWALSKIIGGTETVLASGLGGPTGAVVDLRITGDSTTGGAVAEVLINGVLMTTQTITESIFDGVGNWGIYFGQNTSPTEPLWDDFRVFAHGTPPGGDWELPVERQVPAAATWRATSGSLALYASCGTAAHNVRTIDTGLANGRIRVTLNPRNFFRIVFRYEDKDNYLCVQAANTFGGWALIQRIDGTETIVTNYPLTSTADGIDVAVEFVGDVVRTRINGAWAANTAGDYATVLPDASAALRSMTRHGIAQASNEGTGTYTMQVFDWRFDHFINLGLSGSTIAHGGNNEWGGTYADILQALPRLDAHDIVAMVWGINDAILAANQAQRTTYAHALRTVLYRCFATQVYEDDDATVAYTGTWSTTAAIDANSGDGYHTSSVVGSKATITVPDNFYGDDIVLGFIGHSDDEGGTATVKLNGTLVDTIDTNDAWVFWDFLVGVPLLIAGDQVSPGDTIEVEVTSGTIDFDYWQVQGACPQVIVANIARIVQAPDFNPTSVGASTVTLTGAGWTIDAYAGRTLIVYDDIDGSTVQSRTITANTADTITVSSAFSPALTTSSNIHVNIVGAWGSINEGQVAALNEVIDTVAAEFDGVTVFDMDSTLDKNLSLFNADGLHPSDAGAAAIGAGIAALVAEPSWDAENANINTDANPPVALQEFSYDATAVVSTGCISVLSPAFVLPGGDSVGPCTYLADGTLVAAKSGDAVAWLKLYDGERRFASTMPISGYAWEDNYGYEVAPDWYIPLGLDPITSLATSRDRRDLWAFTNDGTVRPFYIDVTPDSSIDTGSQVYSSVNFLARRFAVVQTQQQLANNVFHADVDHWTAEDGTIEWVEDGTGWQTEPDTTLITGAMRVTGIGVDVAVTSDSFAITEADEGRVLQASGFFGSTFEAPYESGVSITFYDTDDEVIDTVSSVPAIGHEYNGYYFPLATIAAEVPTGARSAAVTVTVKDLPDGEYMTVEAVHCFYSPVVIAPALNTDAVANLTPTPTVGLASYDETTMTLVVPMGAAVVVFDDGPAVSFGQLNENLIAH